MLPTSKHCSLSCQPHCTGHKMKSSIFLIALVLSVGTSLAIRKSFEGYKLLRITAQNQKHLDILQSIREGWENTEPAAAALVNFWTEPSLTGPTDLMVTPDAISIVETLLEGNSIPFSVQMKNVETLVQNQLVLNEAALAAAAATGSPRIGWTAYNRYTEVMDWLDELAETYFHATLESIGSSTEGRDLKLIKISTPGGQPNKSAIFIDGNFHAREWISPAVTTYIINQLVTNASAYTDILDRLDFYILPIVNPDGYEYTQTDRMWRKTRAVNSGSTCRGVDPNRNFDIDFGGSGSSTNPCAETFLGTSPFNIPETRLLSNYIQANANKFRAYLSMHSYSQAWLTPYAWSSSPPPNFNDIMNVGRKAIEALEGVYGTRYVVGPTSTTLYFHSGASQDWTKDVTNIKYTYTVELRDTGTYGFLLPPNQILPTSIETWTAVQVVAREIMNEV